MFAALSCRVSWLPGEAVCRFRQHAFPWEILQLEAVHWWWVQDRTVNPFGQKHPYILLRGNCSKAVFNVCDSWFHTSRVRNPVSCQFVEKPSKWPSCSTCSQNSVLRSLTPAGSAARPTWFWDFYIFWTGLLTHFMSETSPRKGLILWVSSGSTPSQICCKCYCIQSQLLAGV